MRLNYGRKNIIMKNEAELWKEEAELWKKEHHHVCRIRLNYIWKEEHYHEE